MIERYELHKHIRITGWIGSREVREELLAARALVLPSFAEGLPVVIMEAMALRRPVLSTYVAGIPELVQSGQQWVAVPRRLGRGVVQRDESSAWPLRWGSCSGLGDAAYERVITRHSIDTEASKLAGLLRSAS